MIDPRRYKKAVLGKYKYPKPPSLPIGIETLNWMRRCETICRAKSIVAARFKSPDRGAR